MQNTRVIQILGTGYYHPVLPLIPAVDREEQVLRWKGIASHLFHRTDFSGFWPPEMGFSMELIPMLRRAGYRYVLVDSNYVTPVSSMRWEELRYRPHVARWGGEEIVVVVRDRDLSDAQESGMDAGWFIEEVGARTKFCDFVPLVTTATDGDNGGWFRNTTMSGNFWGHFYRDLVERVRREESGGIRPTFIDEYLAAHGAHGEVTVGTGAWNTGWHSGAEFVQWTGSQAQQGTLIRVAELSQAVHESYKNALGVGASEPELYRLLEEARWRVLRAETSCNFYWGEAWLERCHDDLNGARWFLEKAGARF